MHFRNLEKALNIANGVTAVAKLRFWDCPRKHKNISDIRTYKPNTA